jgi:hypothetical protein
MRWHVRTRFEPAPSSRVCFRLRRTRALPTADLRTPFPTIAGTLRCQLIASQWCPAAIADPLADVGLPSWVNISPPADRQPRDVRTSAGDRRGLSERSALVGTAALPSSQRSRLDRVKGRRGVKYGARVVLLQAVLKDCALLSFSEEAVFLAAIVLQRLPR